MALIKCPECGLSISDKAAACPNCGYPLQPAPEPVEYELQKTSNSDSSAADFVRFYAVLVWIGGLVLAIIAGYSEKMVGTYYTYSEKAFGWGVFFTVLLICALCGGLIWSVASLFDDVHNIRTLLSSLQLSKKNVSRLTGKKQQSRNKSSHTKLQSSDNADDEMADSVPSVSAEDLFTFGSYPQTDDGDVDSPIVWQILAKKGDKALLISQYALESLPYNADGGNVAWENCSLRSWLNDEFYNRAFSSDEKAYIIKPDDASKNPDNVFLLSSSDAKAYFHGDFSRICLPTDYANSQGIHLDEQSSAPSSCYWWLRSSDANNSFAECVCNDGSISSRGYEVDSTAIGVRPCIWVLLS